MAAQSTPTDFVMIDTEHSATNVRALENLIRTAEAAGVILYVHVPDLHSEVDILRRGKSVQGHRQTSHEIKKKDRLATVSLKPIRNRLRSYPSRRSMPLKRDRSCDWARASGAADAERDITRICAALVLRGNRDIGHNNMRIFCTRSCEISGLYSYAKIPSRTQYALASGDVRFLVVVAREPASGTGHNCLRSSSPDHKRVMNLRSVPVLWSYGRALDVIYSRVVFNCRS